MERLKVNRKLRVEQTVKQIFQWVCERYVFLIDEGNRTTHVRFVVGEKQFGSRVVK